MEGANLGESNSSHGAPAFVLEPHGIEEDPIVTLQRFQRHLEERTAVHLGYPYNLHLASEDLGSFLRFSLNNLGDPFVESNYSVHSRAFEAYVLEFFASTTTSC